MQEWRALFCDAALSIAVVQINLFPKPPEPGVIAIREAQARPAKVISNCRLVRMDDLGEHEKMHPEDKRTVSLRICHALEKLEAEQ